MAYSYNAKTGEFEGPVASSRSASSRTTSPIASVYHTTAAQTPIAVRLASMPPSIRRQYEALIEVTQLSSARQAELEAALRRIEEQNRESSISQQPAQSSHNSLSSGTDNSWIWYVLGFITFMGIIL